MSSKRLLLAQVTALLAEGMRQAREIEIQVRSFESEHALPAKSKPERPWLRKKKGRS